MSSTTLKRVYRGVTQVPTAGEMDTPVLVYDVTDVPDDSTGFDTNLQPVAKFWAKVVAGRTVQVSRDDPVQASEEVTQLITRMPDEKIEYGYVFFMNDQAYKLVYSTPLGVRDSHVSYFIIAYSSIKKSDALVVDGDGNVVADPAVQDTADKLWVM